jgi:hypothetical protein
MKSIHGGRALGLLCALILAACGGAGSTTTSVGAGPNADCEPGNSATADACGTVLVSFTDADGDFLDYTVDVLSLTLETANGRSVEVLPQTTRVNFTDYIDVAELVSAASVPPGTYVSGTIRLDYSNAEVFVEADGQAKEAIVTDSAGNPLTQTDLKIVLSDRDRLVVTRLHSQLLQLDFDLAASHTVDIAPTPATAAAEPFIVAEASPVDEKDLRVRGLLADVDESAMNYTVEVRPFYDHDGDFGDFTVGVTGDTTFYVDGTMYTGPDGLAALAAAGTGTPTVAKGTLTTADRSFTADLVLAGSSVPGADRDAVVGNIIGRDRNTLTIRGASVVPRWDAADWHVHFHDDVVVEVGPDTKVFKDGDPQAEVGIGDLSIGQRVTVLGDRSAATMDPAAPVIRFDATEGAVRMHVTQIAGVVNGILPGQADITLYSIDRRQVGIFDFAGTGPSADLDADPDNYEVLTSNLDTANLVTGQPISVRGFPTAFGMAPPDFAGRSVIDYSDARSALGVGWGSEGTVAPFVSIGPDGLVLDNGNVDIDARHYIKQGPVLVDLTTLDSDTTIVPRATDRMLFAIRTADSLRLYSDWGDFIADLSTSLDGATTARSMYAYGSYDSAANTFTAYKLGVFLLEP